MTVACCLIDKKEGTVDYARGGHGPLLIRHTDGRIEEIKPQGAAVGMLDNELSFGFDTFSFAWPIGTSMLMYTDVCKYSCMSEPMPTGVTTYMRFHCDC